MFFLHSSISTIVINKPNNKHKTQDTREYPSRYARAKLGIRVHQQNASKKFSIYIPR